MLFLGGLFGITTRNSYMENKEILDPTSPLQWWHVLTDWRGSDVTLTFPRHELKKPRLDNVVRVSHASSGKTVWLHICVGWWCWCESSMWSTVWIILLLKRCRMKSLGPDRGRKSPADSHIEQVQSPPASSRDITIWREAYTACWACQKDGALFTTHFCPSSLSSGEALTIQPSVHSRLPHKSPPTAWIVHSSAGGRNRMDITHLGLYKTVNKYDG